MSSIKAVADLTNISLTENMVPQPLTDYGKSKLAAEEYMIKQLLPYGKKLYILRPCIIHGPDNKGNLNLLYKIVSRQIPWPLAAFENKRSFCSVDNLCFIIKELIEREDISSGIYNLSDDEPVSTNELIRLMAQVQKKKSILLTIPKGLIRRIAKLGDNLSLPLNSERLQKLTESYVVNNHKLMKAIGKPLPMSAIEGLMKTFKAFNQAQ
jgi:nucleoside-diphosphate-sugar epimerase